MTLQYLKDIRAFSLRNDKIKLNELLNIFLSELVDWPDKPGWKQFKHCVTWRLLTRTNQLRSGHSPRDVIRINHVTWKVCRTLDFPYHSLFLFRARLFGEFEVCGAHHRFLHAQVRQQVVVLHDVARHLAELASIALLSVHQNRTGHRFRSLNVKRMYMYGTVHAVIRFFVSFKQTCSQPMCS